MADNQQYGPLAPKQTSASDIRSVIANATKTSGKGLTIATKDELNKKKDDKENAKKVKTTNIATKTSAPSAQNIKRTVVNNKGATITKINPQQTNTTTTPTKAASLTQGQISGDLFKNPAVEPINDVKVEQINGKNKQQSEAYNNYHLDKNEIKNMLKVETPEERQKRMSEGVEKLYIDAYRKKKDGAALTVEDVLGNANYQKELNGLEQGQIQEMVNDANTLANAGKFDMDNAIALFDKYQDLGISMDYSKLSPQSKAQFVGDILNNKKSTLGKIISWATPMGQISNIKELITGRSFSDTLLDTITSLEESSHKNLTDKDADKIAAKYIKELDEGFKDYYDLGKKAPSLVDYATNIKNAGDLYYKHKYGVDEDQKIWKDKDKEREYNEKLNEIRSLVKEKHGDTAGNVARNALIGSAKALLTVSNMASDLPGFGKMIWDLGKGGVEDFVGGVATVGKTAYDTAKYAKDTGDFEVQWDAKDIRQRVAEAGGYDNYNDFVAKVEQEMGDNPLGQFLAWSLKDADTSMDTANSLGNYFIEKYGTLDDGLTAFKNDPVEATSDWIPLAQFKIKLLEKLGLVSSARANKIIDASRWLDAYDKPFELVNKFQFGPLLKMEGKLLGGVSKLGLGTISLPFKLVSRTVDAVFSKLTGIDKESRNFIRENPDEVLSYVNGEKTSDGILRDIKDKFDEITDEKRTIGEEYETIKNNDVPVKSKEILDNIMNTLSEFGVKISDKGVEYTKILPQFVEKNVKELLRFVDDYKKKGETPSASETHYFRQLVDTLAKWESNTPAKGIEAQFINSVKDIRRTIDNALKEQVPGMKEADAAYSAVLDTIKELRQDWFNKDGTLKDGAYSRIRNLTNKGSNQPKLERLEKVIPGITKKLKSLAVSEVIERGMKQATGQYLNQIASGAGLGAIASLLTGGVSLPTLIIGALGMMYATPENFAHLLRFEGKVTKPIRDIANKIGNRTKLTAKETSNLVDFMLDNQERLGKTAQYMYEKGLLDEPAKASDIKAPKSKDPTLKELTDYKESLKKALKEGKISQKYYDDEIHGKNGEPGIDYAIAQKKARAKTGDKEHVLSAEDKERVTNFIKKRAKDVGFVTEMFENLPFDSGFTNLRDKLIAFSKNPGDTTAKHELFHAFFSVCDNKTKTYLIQEARKILKDNGMAIKDAEEWLAESFGIYAKRKMIDLGMIKDAPKGFVDKLRNFFQKVYEYMQKFNGDRDTINKIFDEVLGEKQMKDGIMDLSDLLGDKKLDKKLLREIELGDNGLRNKSVYHGSPADFDKFDSSHMGEGEGAQAHGWGHYVAVEERTGRHYAEMKNSTNYEYKGRGLKDIEKELSDSKPGEKVELIPIKQMLDSDWMSRYQKGERFDEIKKEGLERAKREMESTKEIYEENPEGKLSSGMTYKERYEIDKRLYDAWKNLDKKDFDFEKPNRNLYNLDIPDPVKADTPTGSNYLEESGMIDGFQKNEFLLDVADKYGNDAYFTLAKAVGVDPTGRDLYRGLEKALGSDKKASKYLESLGYDGIHYHGGRDGEAYVIFNDDALKIKEHIRYKKKIGDKDVEITPEADSPDQLIEKNADGLSVMKSFVSEKQAEKALDVNKALLDKDGNPYLWTHTNKYDAPQFANFENAKDSKYKEFGDYEIAWFSNSEDMSRSYANQESKLADTKPINSIEEFNDRFSKYDIDGTPYNTEWKKGDNKEWKYGHKTSIDKEGNEYVLNQYDSESHKYKDLETLYNEWHNGGYDGQSEKEVIDGIKQLVHEEFIDSPDFRLYDDVDIKKEKDGYVLTTSSKKEQGRYKSEQEALAKSTAKKHVSGKYHYQGIITDIKNPLVVDLGKYKPGEIKHFKEGARMMGEHGRYWSDLGNAYEFVKREQPNIDEIFSKIEKEWKGAKDSSRRIIKNAFDIEREADNLYKAYKDMEEGPAKKFAEDRLMLYRDAGDKIGYIGKGVVDELKPEQRNLRVEVMNEDLKGSRTTTIGELYDEAIADYKKYKDVYDVFGEGNRLWKESGKYSQPEGYDKSKNINFINLLKKNGMSEGAISILHGTDLMNRIDLTYSPFSSEGWAITKLRDKSLQTNDYVFYALRKGGYDGVLFKDIVDYGGKGDNKGGDVLAAFKSSDFKAWDNANPTDSKYISYKKKVSLDKKSEGLQKKNSSGLLAKGRERMGDNGMRYKKSEYEKAVESGDKEKALGMIRKAAAEKGYDSSSDYQGSKAFNGSAPSSEGYTKAERINPDTEIYSQTLGDYASDGVDIGDLDWQLTDRGNYIRGDEYIRESIDNLNKAVREYKAGNKNAKIKMYRAIDADIKENGFRNGDWITPSKKYAKMHIGLQDWKKGRIIEEEVPIENIWWDNNDINEWGYDDGKEYGYKNTPNNKKELGITYDDKGKLIPLEKRFDEKNPDVRFKKKSEVPEDKKLVGLHNLGIDKLRGVIELGGMPMPSIAVTKKGVPHESYGDITFIMKESAINPALSRKNKLYTVDGYTPTVPQPTIRVKDTKEANLLMDKIQKETGIGYGELMQWLEYHDDRYFKDYPKLKEFDKYYDQLTEKKLFDGFTYTGKRRYKDYNLDNIVKSMVGNKRDAFNGAFWKMVAQSQGNTTVEKLRDRKYGLKDKDLAEKMGEKYYDALRELASKKGIEQKIESLSDYGRFAENVSDAYRANTDAWWRELTQWDGAEGTIYSKITKEDLEPLQKIIKEAAELPRPYSEAKPERAIRFDEVGAVVAPEGKLKEVKDMLKDTGLKVYGYKEGERMSVVDKVADDNGLRFKRKNTDDIVGHASPYSFDKYDASKRATGYGGQVYGAGIYTSEDLGMVAGKYGKKDADKFNSETMYKGLPLREQYDEKYVAQIMHDSMMKGLTFKEAKQEIVDAWKDTKDPNKKAMLKELGLMKKSDFDGKGNLYTYKIDKDGKWLDWQQKTSPEDVNLISKELEKINKEGAKKFDDYMKSSEYATLGQNIYQELSRTLGGDQKASDFLKSIGFEGNKYKAESNKYNYVIFDYDKPINEHIRFKKQTDTPEFKKWFEGSKVVDKSGKPLEVYHGSTDTFNVFDKNKIGKNAKKVGPGFYFTDVKSEADTYQKHYNALKDKYENYEVDKPRTIAAYLDIKNPIRIGEDILSKEQMVKILNQGDYDWGFDNWLPRQIQSINEFNIKKINGKSYTPEEVRNMSKEQKIDLYVDKLMQDSRGKDDLMLKFLEEVSNVYHYDNKGRVLDVLKEVTGNDGVIYEQVSKWNPDRKYPTQYVAWESNQIKSATDNIGTFDKNNPDIRFKKGLEKKSDGLEKKRTTTLSKHSEEINRIASQLGVKGDNDMQKIKSMNKEIKDPKYQGTKIKKELYNLKWQIKKDYIIDHNKKIVDKGPKNTTVRVVQNGVQATWHFNQKQYKELKKMGVLIKNKKKRE